MKKLSLWAKDHKRQARWIIVISFIVLTASGVLTGLLLRDINVYLPFAALCSFVLLYFAAGVLYPRKKRIPAGYPAKAAHYRRQKTCDVLLVASTFLMIIYLANQPRQAFRYSFPFDPAMASNLPLTPKDSLGKTYKSLSLFNKTMKDGDGKLLKWKERKKLLKVQVKGIRQANDLSKGAKAALIVLSVLIAMGLIILVGALACNISCSGSEGLAIIVAIGGVALVIVLLAVVIKRIVGKKKAREPENPPPGN